MQPILQYRSVFASLVKLFSGKGCNSPASKRPTRRWQSSVRDLTGNVEAEETTTGLDLSEVTINDSGDQSLDRSAEPEADQTEIQTEAGFFRKPGTVSETAATASRPSRPSVAEGSRRPALTATSQSDRADLEPQTQVPTTSLAPVGAPSLSNMANVTMEVNSLLNRVRVP